MLKKFNLINSSYIKKLNILIKEINKSKYQKIFFFPFNIYSRFLKQAVNKKSNFIVDNYLNDKSCIKPYDLTYDKKHLLVVTDKNLYVEQKFNKNLKTIFFNSKLKVENKIDLDKKKLTNINLSKLFIYFNSDKGKIYKRLNFEDKAHNYGIFYDKNFEHLKNKKINILEIGSYRGSSAAAFLNYFENANIFCADMNHENFLFKSRRIKLIQLNYMKKNEVDKFTNNYQNFFDIIIDDGGHYKSHILSNIKNFYNCLKRDSSLYVIEDFGLKFDYLNDIKSEPDIFKVIQCLNNKQKFKSKILDESMQYKLINSLKKISVYKGSWIKYEKNISDICFLELKNLK
jgi:hypothetical protein